MQLKKLRSASLAGTINQGLSEQRDIDIAGFKTVFCEVTKQKVIVQLLIPKETKVIFYELYDRKITLQCGCAEYADVINILPHGLTSVENVTFRPSITYEVGKRAYSLGVFTAVGGYKAGIHFTLSQSDAEQYGNHYMKREDDPIDKLFKQIREKRNVIACMKGGVLSRQRYGYNPETVAQIEKEIWALEQQMNTRTG